MLRPFSLTFVSYEQEDPVYGWLFALSSLIPIFIVVMYCSIIGIRRDFQTAFALIGQLVSVVLNIVLKEVIAEPRPPRIDEREDFGMPSNHAQFIFHFSTFYCLQLIFRTWKVSIFYRLFYSFVLIAMAVTVSFGRIYLGYHTYEQVGVGCLVGLSTGTFFHSVAASSSCQMLSNLICSSDMAKWLCIRNYSRVGYSPVLEYEAMVNAGYIVNDFGVSKEKYDKES